MQVLVKSSGRTITCSLPNQDVTTDVLKELVGEKIGVPARLFRLKTLTGKTIMEGFTLHDFGIHNESSLLLDYTQTCTLRGARIIDHKTLEASIVNPFTQQCLQSELDIAIQLLADTAVVKDSFLCAKYPNIAEFSACLEFLRKSKSTLKTDIAKSLLEVLLRSSQDMYLHMDICLLFLPCATFVFDSPCGSSEKLMAGILTGLHGNTVTFHARMQDLLASKVVTDVIPHLQRLLSTYISWLPANPSSSSEREKFMDLRRVFELISIVYCTHKDTVDSRFFLCEAPRFQIGSWLLKIKRFCSDSFVETFSFLFDSSTKQALLTAELEEARSSSSRFGRKLRLDIDRENLLRHTMTLIGDITASEDLKMPVKVRFIGEEGEDQGGLRREFFQLLSRELLDSKFGMFTPCGAEAESLWICKDCTWSPCDYEIVGKLLGLAVYNEINLDVSFCRALYKKLLREEVGLSDLQVLDPALHKGLTQLLQHEPCCEVEDVFCRTFEVSWIDTLGVTRTYELIPHGAQLAVTGLNRAEFVDRYCRWYLTDAVATQFDAFCRGFFTTLPRHFVRILKPTELEHRVEGVATLDFDELESSAEYEGWSGRLARIHPTVHYLWRFLHSLDSGDKKRFLMFVCGSMRAPLAGLKSLKFTVQRAGPDSDLLPTAHTCFNTLVLPEYTSEAKLCDKLRRAIAECEGFGFL